jgi:hypothetical protein
MRRVRTASRWESAARKRRVIVDVDEYEIDILCRVNGNFVDRLDDGRHLEIGIAGKHVTKRVGK